MPYYVLPKDAEVPELTACHSYGYREQYNALMGNPVLLDACSFYTRADAFQTVKDVGQQSTHRIVFIASPTELSDWRRRERERFSDGTYVQVPWEGHETDATTWHYAHLSTDKPGMVAYTPDAEAGVNDRQTRTTPGRYLEKFYTDAFSRTQIADYVARVSAMKSTYSLATTAEDITAVYENGPESCMGGGEDHTGQYWYKRNLAGHHPCEVYASPSDLAVAYFGELDSPSQRAVVWPAKKTYVRIYGTGPLEHLLRKDDYSKASDFDGARLVAIDISRSGRPDYVVPYVDGSDSATVRGDFLVLGSGRINMQMTFGHTRGTSDALCSHCQDEIYDTDDTGDLCQSCYDDVSTCDGCQDRVWDGTTEIDGSYYCDSCVDGMSEVCQDANCSNRFVPGRDFTENERSHNAARDMADLCPTCVARYVYCEHCETPYDPTVDSDSAECPNCDRLPRCEKTADLLTAGPYPYVLEVYDPLAPVLSWKRCVFDDARTPAVSDDFNKLIPYREKLQAQFPRAMYRIVPDTSARMLIPAVSMMTQTEVPNDSPF